MDNIKTGWSNIQNKKTFLLFLVFALAGFMVFIFLVFSILGRPPSNQKPSSADPDGPGEEYTKEQKELEDEFLDKDKESSRVSQLIDKLPYKGSNFLLEYSYGSLQFTLTLNEKAQSQGLAEFNQFLSANSIDANRMEENLIKKTSPSL